MSPKTIAERADHDGQANSFSGRRPCEAETQVLK